ncbi:4-hydroxythreonine-4-phosphate dehydrogenase PdxA [Limnohabitans sp.]|uniref:4-hydroxythreonine-4-phosphate dehydrogenase PdxA n=1 Tax=Limnohabitans sp. TaxID=1907725 RepID=UPI00286EE64A|nr:4-hydroxythreonine-4-phosphate dehydrogenase PdxA [Limnohabitans sp.]
MADHIRPMAITLGDAAGIGPEIIVKAFRDAPEQLQGCVVVGDLAVMQRAALLVAQCEYHAPQMHIQWVSDVQEVALVKAPFTIPVLQVTPALAADQLPAWGQISATAGKLAADCVVWAAQAALRGEVSAVVTAPLHKEALFAAGVPFPGHTEMLQACAAAHAGVSVGDMPVRMMLANPELKTVLVSIHVPLRKAIDAVTVDNILQTLRITHAAELATTGRAPHMAVAGLNPHAGEGGLMGREELDIIIPALQLARAEGMQVSGPFAPDTVFMRARAKNGKAGEFDVVIAMYHDQGLIPVKYLGVEYGVNVTLGLPLVRTSPDHGTAFDVAGTAKADASSLLAAVAMARAMCG